MQKNDDNEIFGRHTIKENFIKWSGLFFVVLAAMFVYLFITNINSAIDAFLIFLGYIKPVIYGFVIAYLLNPMTDGILNILRKIFKPEQSKNPDKKNGLLIGISISLSIFIGIVLIIILGWLIIPQLIETLTVITKNLPGQTVNLYNELKKWLATDNKIAKQISSLLLQGADFFGEKINSNILPWIQNKILPNINDYAGNFASGVKSVINVFYNLFIGIIVAIYMLLGKKKFSAQGKKILYAVMKKKHADVVLEYARFTNDTFKGFISGKILDSAIIGLICYVIMLIFNLPYAVLISVIVGVTNIIPVFGPYIGVIPSILIILLVNPMQALYFLIIIIIIQQVDGNIIGPAILGESTGLSAFWVLFSILVFGGIWGIGGMLVGVPLFAVLYKIISDSINAGLSHKKLSSITDDYVDLKEIILSESNKEAVYVKYSEKNCSEEKNEIKKREKNKSKNKKSENPDK